MTTGTKLSDGLICEEVLEEIPEDDSTSSESQKDGSFITWLHGFSATKMMTFVDEDYIRDGFNRQNLGREIGLSEKQVTELVGKILNGHMDEFDKTTKTKAIDVYGLLHARFIMTHHGMDQMRSLFSRGVFGTCPRHYCYDQNCLPIGEDPRIGKSPVKIFCPRCKQIYKPKHYHDLDGAYFGPSFPSAFFLEFPDLRPPPVIIPYRFPRDLKKRRRTRNEINHNSRKKKCP